MSRGRVANAIPPRAEKEELWREGEGYRRLRRPRREETRRLERVVRLLRVVRPVLRLRTRVRVVVRRVTLFPRRVVRVVRLLVTVRFR